MKKSLITISLTLILLGAACQKKPVSVTPEPVNETDQTLVNQALNRNMARVNTNTSTVNTNIAVTVNTNSAGTSGVTALPLAQRVGDASSTLNSPVKVAMTDGQGYFIVGQPAGQNSKVTKKIIFSLPGHGTTAESDYNAWKAQIADNDYALASVNWWDGSGETRGDYLEPNEVLTEITRYLTEQGYDAADFVVLEGFSRGSANTYAVKSYDALAASHVIDAVISASGKYQSDFPLAPGALNVAKLFDGVPWILACGGKDDNPERDGCVGMNETKTWLTGEGANVLAVLSDPNGGHGAFHASPLKLVDQALVLLDALPAAQ